MKILNISQIEKFLSRPIVSKSDLFENIIVLRASKMCNQVKNTIFKRLCKPDLSAIDMWDL